MRVAMYYNNKDVRVEEIPVPNIGPGELLVRIRASGICGTDVMEWYRLPKAPLVLGHEISGDVVSVGDGVDKFKAGDRVFVSHHVPCMKCRYCQTGHHSVCDTLRQTHFDPGGFAEYIRVPAINVRLGTFLLPEELSYEEGSFIEPVGCVVRAHRFVGANLRQSVLILGSGISGLLNLQMARSNGAGLVVATDINEFRLATAKRLGADAVLLATDNVPKELRELNEGRLADLVIVCTGALPAAEQAIQSVERGGTLLFFAPTAAGVKVPIPLFDFWRNEISIITSYAASPRDIEESIKLLQRGRIRVNEMITHRLGLNEASLGFRLVTEGQSSIKIIIDPQRPPP